MDKLKNLIDIKKLQNKEEVKKAFGLGLKRLRKFNKVTLKQVEEATDIPFRAVARYENKINIPSIIIAFKFAYYFQMSIEDILIIGFLDEAEAEEYMKKYYRNTADSVSKPEKDKQVEEMAKILCPYHFDPPSPRYCQDCEYLNLCDDYGCDREVYKNAESLYAAGYRKAGFRLL